MPTLKQSQRARLDLVPRAGAIDLSVVFVTRNEEEHFEDCAKSTIAAAEAARERGVIRSSEYILVDSASTDRTIEIARKFPLRILQLGDDWPLSCAAGCYVGLLAAGGTYTAIVNGDMTIDREWFARALPHFRDDVGAVLGLAAENLSGETFVERTILRYTHATEPPRDLPVEIANHRGGFSTGTALLRTEAARAVGSYNPFFLAAEDLDLMHRLSEAGWKVFNLPVYQGLHYWTPGQHELDIGEYLRTIFRNSIGLGQMARYHLGRRPSLAQVASRPALNVRILSNLLLAVSLPTLVAANLAAVASGNLLAAILNLAADTVAVWIFVFAARKSASRGSEFAFDIFYYRPVYGLSRVLGFIRGFLPTSRAPSEYPTNVREIAS